MSDAAPAVRRPPPGTAVPSARTTQRRATRVAVLYNVDFEDVTPDADPGYAARADVAVVASAVATELAANGPYDVHLVPVEGDLARLHTRLRELEPDCAFNLCESLAGDARLESAVPLVLELMGVAFTGSPSDAVSAGLYKDRMKRLLEAAGVPTPAACVMARPNDPCELGFPLIVKPVREDGSVGISDRSVVHSDAELRAAVAQVTERLRQPCLVERFVDGREFNVALLGYPAARALPLSEIDFSGMPVGAPRIVSYDAKWTEGSVDDLGTVPVLHPELPSSLAARVRKAAVEAFRAVGVRDYGRVDVRLSPQGVPFVVDVNPNCDLAKNAGLARAAAGVGFEYGSLLRLLTRYALRRRRAGVGQGASATLRTDNRRSVGLRREEVRAVDASDNAPQGASG
jgi:D-alanine-D-alanine ligase